VLTIPAFVPPCGMARAVGSSVFLFSLLTGKHLSPERRIHNFKGKILSLLQLKRKLPSEPFRVLD